MLFCVPTSVPHTGCVFVSAYAAVVGNHNVCSMRIISCTEGVKCWRVLLISDCTPTPPHSSGCGHSPTARSISECLSMRFSGLHSPLRLTHVSVCCVAAWLAFCSGVVFPMNIGCCGPWCKCCRLCTCPRLAGSSSVLRDHPAATLWCKCMAKLHGACVCMCNRVILMITCVGVLRSVWQGSSIAHNLDRCTLLSPLRYIPNSAASYQSITDFKKLWNHKAACQHVPADESAGQNQTTTFKPSHQRWHLIKKAPCLGNFSLLLSPAQLATRAVAAVTDRPPAGVRHHPHCDSAC